MLPIKKIIDSAKSGLKVLIVPIPMTVTEWADKNFYLSSESSYTEGRWHTHYFQKAILNSMGNDDIQIVDFIKSARVGYTKMLLALMGYNIEHKKRNQMLFQPTDGAASEFMKEHFEPMIRDVPVVKALAPWYGMKHRDSTLERKLFANRKQAHIKGGASAKNYREKSVDTVIYDELAGFEPNVEKEGSPTTLGDKRTEGSVFRKSIRGSTPKIKGECLITLEAEGADHYFERYVPCPHCGEHQVLKFGGKESPFGLKWEKDKPETVYYLCEHNGCVIENNDLPEMDAKGFYQSDKGLRTEDGIYFYDIETGKLAETPHHIAFHIWTIYSPWTTWAQIVKDWLSSQGDSDKLKTFINVTLGEAWEEDRGERIEPHALASRAFDYEWPDEPVITVAGIDTQDNRLEASVYCFSESEECWGIEHIIVPGDTTLIDTHLEMAAELSKRNVEIALQDAMGHSTDTVYEFCKRKRWILPSKGMPGARPLVESKVRRLQRLRKRRKKDITPEPIGVDQGKNILQSRLKLEGTGARTIHFNHHESFDDEFFEQLTAEVIQKQRKGGRVTTSWVALRERNEALDCWILAYCAFLIAKDQKQIKFKIHGKSAVQAIKQTDSKKPKRKPVRSTLFGG